MKRTALFLLFVLCSCSGSETIAPQYGVFTDGLLSNIEPAGWIREYLDRQVTGLSGHPEAMSYPYNTCLWDGDFSRMSTHGAGWWRYEQTAYYSDGLIRLGYALKDSTFIAKIENGIRYTIRSASPDGYLGSENIRQSPSCYMWPQAVYFRAMKAMYDATSDPGIPSALEKYYLNYTPEQIGAGRNIISIEGMLWTYGITRNERLLDLACRAYEVGKFELFPELSTYEGCPHVHGVTFCEEMKLPEILYSWTGDSKYEKIAEQFHSKLIEYNMLPDGVPSSAEHVMGNSVDNGHETCDIADFTWAEGYFLMVDGDAECADRIERAVFNAAPGAVTKDFKAIQYFSNVNQFNVTSDSDPNLYKRGGTWHAYRPTHETECCIGNVHRIMPNYVSRMWLKDKKGNLVASMYGPCVIRESDLTIEENTDYPFGGDIEFVFHPKENSVRTFTFRIPSWSNEYSVDINGKSRSYKSAGATFVSVKRLFKDGDRITLRFDMRPRIEFANGQGVSFNRGPLLFSYRIPEIWTEDTVDHPKMRGKKSENPDFKCWNITPAAPFGYGIETLAVEELKNPEYYEGAYPYDIPPYKLRIPVREIEWNLEDGKFTSSLPGIKVNRLSESGTEIDLVPYGTTQLRLTVFPQLKSVVKDEGLF